jgi:hypothetical protein
MKFLGSVSVLIMLATVAGCGATSSAQGPPTPTAFDGKYVGSATPTRGAGCSSITSAEMTVSGGRVAVREIRFEGVTATYQGSVTATGEVSAFRQMKVPPFLASTVSGAIHDNVFTGHRLTPGNSGCTYTYKLEMVKG